MHIEKNNLIDIIIPIQQLINTTSRIEKERILKENIDNEPFKEVLKYILNKLRICGISTKKLNKQLLNQSFNPAEINYSLIELLNYLDNHNTGTNEDVSIVQHSAQMIASQNRDLDMTSEEIINFVYSIVTKSLRLGVDVKTANKVYGKNFIPKLEVQLGTSIENTTIPQNEKIFISRKLNGTRCFYYKGKLYTRQGKEYTGLEHIVCNLKSTGIIFPNFVFDGELILDEKGLSDSDAFQKGAGIANSKNKCKTNLKLIIFDILPEREFENGISLKYYSQRKAQLCELKTFITDNNLSNLDVVEFLYEGCDHSKISQYLDYAEKNDWEGVMINLDTPYECRRSKNLIKVKHFYTFDLEVIGLEEGVGRNKNRLGNVIVDFKGNSVKVGSGFTDEQRIYYWQNPQCILHKVIEVKYKEITKNKDNGQSLQFPVFIQVREEGKDVSYE